MTQNQLKLCGHILADHFGDTVATVGTALLNKGSMPLGQIGFFTKIKLYQVKKSLCILLHHNVCTFAKTARGVVEYTMDLDTVVSFLRYPRFIYTAKTLYDACAELIVEELLQQGRSLLSSVTTKVMERLNEELESHGSTKITSDFVRDTFLALVKSQFVKTCPCSEGNSVKKESSAAVVTDGEFILPNQQGEGAKRKFSGENLEQAKKKMKLSENSGTAQGDQLWMVNYDRFNLHLRNEIFVRAVTRRVDEKAGEIVRTLLHVSGNRSGSNACTTTPLSVHEIRQGLPKDSGISKTFLEQYLKILIDDSSEIVSKVDESGGGMYSINILKGLKSLCRVHIESMVQEKYGSKCLRIFRMLLMKRHVDQKQIEEGAMVNIKESKEMVYRLYSDGIVNATELCKTPDHAPARTNFLFTVDINQVARTLLQKCYKAMCNSIERRNHELKENKRLLDKQQRVEAIIASLSETGHEEQKAELEEMISPAEKAHINQVTENIKKLEQCEIQIDETLFVLQQYLHYLAVSKKVIKT